MSNLERIEGQRYAVQMVEGYIKSHKPKSENAALTWVLENMAAALHGKPADFAKGVNEIVEAIRAKVHKK